MYQNCSFDIRLVVVEFSLRGVEFFKIDRIHRLGECLHHATYGRVHPTEIANRDFGLNMHLYTSFSEMIVNTLI